MLLSSSKSAFDLSGMYLQRGGRMTLFRWIGLAALFVSPLSATVVFSSIQGTNLGFTEVAGPFTTARGLAFTPTGNYVFQDAQLKVQATATPNVDLYLYSDNGGLPGTLLETIGIGTAPSGSIG